MATIDQQFVEYIVKTLVNNPDKVEVTRTIDEKGVLLSLTVDPEDVGRVIGRRGATAQSIRTLLRALGTKNDARYNLKIVNTDEDTPAPRATSAPAEPKTGEPESSEPLSQDAFITPEQPFDETDDGAITPNLDASDDEDDEDEADDLAERTRAELDELDDLDI